jgi:hypothetical protein
MTFGIIFQEVSWTSNDRSHLMTFHIPSLSNPNRLNFQHPPPNMKGCM